MNSFFLIIRQNNATNNGLTTTLKSITSSAKLLWAAVYFLIAMSFIFLANDNSFTALLSIPSFYSDLLLSLILSFGTGFYLKKLNARLNQSYPWHTLFIARLFWQGIFGILLPLCIVMLLEVIYLYSIEIPFESSSMLHLELPLAFIFLVLVNLIYLTMYLLRLTSKQPAYIDESMTHSPEKLQYITVNKGFIEERIELSNCALIFSSGKMLWLQTFSGEKFRLQGTLEEWEKKLIPVNFYRINRQYLASFRSIHSAEHTETRRLKINFVVQTEEVYVSKANASGFKQWWKQK